MCPGEAERSRVSKVFELSQIQDVVGSIDLVKAMEEGFIAHSQGGSLFLPWVSSSSRIHQAMPISNMAI
jgi:hypothetical protein